MGCTISKNVKVEIPKGEEVSVKKPSKGHSEASTKTERPRSKHLSQNIIIMNSNRDINEGTILGIGVSGTVKICVHRSTKLQFALKRLNKTQLKPEKLAQLRVEIAIMTGLDHPNILRLHEFFEVEEEIFLILELCRGGELIDRLHEQTDHRFSEQIACKLIFTMMSAVRYCHSHDIVHRDLKLENFLFTNRNSDSQLKMIDFGLSQYLKPEEMLHKAGISMCISLCMDIHVYI
jgi:serine/threonine protein kinase